MQEHFARPYFVTPHAVERYQERIERVPARQAIREVQAALQNPVWAEQAGVATLFGCRRADGRLWVVVVMQSAERSWPSVVTVGQAWRWHEYRHLWL